MYKEVNKHFLKCIQKLINTFKNVFRSLKTLSKMYSGVDEHFQKCIQKLINTFENVFEFNKHF